MEVKIDEPLLKDVARLTDGKYFRATNTNSLRKVYQEIDKLEKSKIDVTEFRRKSEQYLLLALVGLGLLVLEVLLRNLYFKNIP